MSIVADAHITAHPADGGERTHPAEYLCPGEPHPVSRSVHLARLAAFYPNCRGCEHRCDTGNLPRQIVERIDRVARREVRTSLLTPDGIRGVYLNELGRPQAEQYAAAFASLLWESHPRHGRTEEDTPAQPQPVSRPTIVLGRDARPCSPEMAVGVAAALRRMGCHVIDVGLVSIPCLWFAVEHLDADGGIGVTGHGCHPSMTGLDFLERRAIPWSQGLSLDRVETIAQGVVSRPTRRGGPQTTFRATLPYLAGLQRHFHALRPLQIGVACHAPTVVPLLNDLFTELPCRLRWLDAPDSRGALPPSAPALNRLAALVRSEQLHAGVLIGEDGQSLQVLNERGRPMPLTSLLPAFAQLCAADPRTAAIAVDESLAHSEIARLSRNGWRVSPTAVDRESLTRALRQSNIVLAADAAGRCWFRDHSPPCDALLTLARLLQSLSLTDAPASSLAAA